ncbi:hypothetical protein ES703_100213 [subsurface metagenome]
MTTRALTVLLGGIAAAAGACVSCELLHITTTKATAFDHARQLDSGKGIINLGAGPHRTFGAQIIAEAPEVLANIDVALNGMPHFLQLDIETDPLPFSDKQFGVAFLSHVLEHLDNWQFALDEALRVADYVVVVLPHPAYFSGWLSPEHKQHFSVDDINEIAGIYPNVVVYY